MDTSVVLSILSLASGFGTAAFFVIRWILTRNDTESDYQREQRWGKQDYFKLLDDRAKELQDAKAEMATLMVKIDLLQSTIDQLKKQAEEDREEIAALRHELHNWKQGEVNRKEITKQEVKDEIKDNVTHL